MPIINGGFGNPIIISSTGGTSVSTVIVSNNTGTYPMAPYNNADYLNHKAGDYYLNRSNHVGTMDYSAIGNAPHPLNIGVLGTVYNSGTVYFYAGNNVTLSTIGNSVSIIANAGGGGGANVSMIGNTTGNPSLISSGTFYLAGGSNVTLSQSGNSISIIGQSFSQSVQTQGTFNTTQLNNYQLTANMSNYQSSGNYLTTQTIQTQGTFDTNSLSNYQLTANNSLSLGTDYTTHTHPQYVNTSQSSLFAFTSNDSLSLGVGYTTHTHGQYVNTSISSNFLTTQTVQPVAASAANGSFAFSTLKFIDTNGVTWASSTDGIRASVKTDYQSSNANYLTSQTVQPVAFSASGSSSNFSTLQFGNSNGVSFSISNGSLVATVKTDYQSSNANYLTSQSNPAFSASGGSSAFQTLNFANSNGLTFSNSNGSVIASYTVPTQTVQTQNLHNITLSGNSTSAGAGYIQVSSGTLTLAGGNNITLSQNGNAITISGANVGGAQTAISGVAASNTTYTSGTVSFADSNGITWGTGAGQAINITHALQYTSNTSNITSNALNTSASRVINIIAATNNTGGGTASLSSNVSFSNANNITFYTSAGGAIAASFSQSVDTNKAGTGFTSAGNNIGLSGTLNTNGLSLSATVPAQTNQTVGIYASSQTTGSASSGTHDARSLSFIGAGIISIGNHSTSAGGTTTGILISATQSGQAFSAGAASSAFQTLSFQDSNGLSFSNNAGAIRMTHDLQYTSNTSNITSNALNTSVSRVINIVAATNNTGGGTASLSSNVSFSNANGLTFYTSAGGAIVGSHNALTTAALSSQTLAFSLSGNTATTNSSQILNGGFALAGGNGVTLQQSNNTVSISVATNYQSQGAYLTTAALSSQTIAFSLSGNSATTNSSQILNGGYALAGGNGVTLQQSNNTISFSVATNYQSQGAYLTTAAQSNQVVNALIVGTATNAATNQSSSLIGSLSLSNLNGMSFYTTVSGATSGIAASYTVPTVTNSSFSVQDSATTINPIQRIAFSTGNNITLSLSTGASSATVGIQHNLAGTSSGFAGNLISGSITHNSSGINISLTHPAWISSQTNQTLSMAFTGNTTANSSGVTVDARSLTIQGLGIASVGASTSAGGSSIIVSVPANSHAASASNGSFSFQTINFSNANNVTFGTSAGGIITASVAAPGAAAENNWVNLLGANTAGNTTASGSTIGYSGINLTLSGTNGSVVNISAPATSSISGTGLVSVQAAGSTISIGVPGTTISRQYFWPYGQMSSSQQTNSQMSFRYFSIDDVVSFTKVELPINVSIGSSAAANTANLVITSGAGIYSRNGSTLNPIVASTGSTTYTWASNTANYSSVIGGRYATWGLATTLPPGEYWLGAFISTANNSSIGTATTAVANTISVFIGSFLTAQNFNDFGDLTNYSSLGPVQGQGLVSITISNTTMTYQLSQITQSGASGLRGNIWFNLRNV